MSFGNGVVRSTLLSQHFMTRWVVFSALISLRRGNKCRFIRVHGVVGHHVRMQPNSTELGRARFPRSYCTVASTLAILAIAFPSFVLCIPSFQQVDLTPDNTQSTTIGTWSTRSMQSAEGTGMHSMTWTRERQTSKPENAESESASSSKLNTTTQIGRYQA